MNTDTIIKNDMDYQKNLALCKYHTGEDVTAEDFASLVKWLSPSAQQNTIFFLILRWLSSVKNTALNDFGAWVVHARQTVGAAALACGKAFSRKDEQEFVSLGLAVRTYPFSEGNEPLAKYCTQDILKAFLELPMEKPEQIWAMEAVGSQMIEVMTADPERDLHLMIRLMAALVKVHNEMDALE